MFFPVRPHKIYVVGTYTSLFVAAMLVLYFITKKQGDRVVCSRMIVVPCFVEICRLLHVPP